MPAIVIRRTETQGIQPERNTDQNKLVPINKRQLSKHVVLTEVV